jgi:hypothetical protein
VHESLLETSGHIPPSLLELHLGATGESVDNREDVKPAGTKKAPVKLRGLAKMVNVQAADARGTEWEGEVDERVSSVLGSRPKSPRTARTPSPSARSVHHQSPLSSPNTTFPSTQPLGDSDLGNRYARERTPISEVKTPEEDELVDTPMPPSSQKRRYEIENDQENTDPMSEEDAPFRRRGGPQAARGLPGSTKRSDIWQDWGSKRYRPGGLSY